ncbi:MAG: dTMP kinase [Abditibacteriota bacterium]|nr:dTMP kinase [Abditibacteriota bacterium]
MFISFEGIDGSGKTTLARALRQALLLKGVPCLLTREPGGAPAGERIRELLLAPDCTLPAEAEAYLFLASRAANVRDCILPALRRGETVISDRFSDSLIAYQGRGMGGDTVLLKALSRAAAGGLAPDVTFLLDISPEEALERNTEPDRYSRDPEFLKRVRQGFLDLAAEEPERMQVIDAQLPPEAKLDIIKDTLIRMGMEELI